MRKPFKEISKKLHEKLDREGEESNEEEEESTTSSEKSEQDSENDTSTEDEEESNITQTLQVHHVMNEKHMIEENPTEAGDDTSEEENVAEMQTYENNGEQNNEQDNKLLTTNFELNV